LRWSSMMNSPIHSSFESNSFLINYPRSKIFFMSIEASLGYILAQHRQLVTHNIDYQLIINQLYKLVVDEILHRCTLENEWNPILNEAHEVIVGGHNVGKNIAHKLLNTTTKYLTIWAKLMWVKVCIETTEEHLIFENAMTRFWCSRVSMSDQRSHFLNYTIQQLTQDFMIHHQKSTPYHTQANGMTETSNIILENDLTKVFY
jgi:hypothetical protein